MEQLSNDMKKNVEFLAQLGKGKFQDVIGDFELRIKEIANE